MLFTGPFDGSDFPARQQGRRGTRCVLGSRCGWTGHAQPFCIRGTSCSSRRPRTARGGRGGSVGSVAAAGSRVEGANRVSGQVKPGRSSEKSHGVSRTPARGAESVSTKVCEHIQFILGSKAIFTSCLLVTKSACGAAGLF